MSVFLLSPLLAACACTSLLWAAPSALAEITPPPAEAIAAKETRFYQSAIQAEDFISRRESGRLQKMEAEFRTLREDEARVRRELEGELTRLRAASELDAAATAKDKLCATPFGIDIVGITEAVALVGALVGGLAARQRKIELEVGGGGGGESPRP